MDDERPLREQVDWLRRALQSRVRSRERHVADAAAGTDWRAVKADVLAEAPEWVTDEAKRIALA